ncbi:NAD(P)H nitroreductase [Nocardia sp. XZ_19_231]|uniref:NAD(P)H nitroreductase n=1 Tax=Nocardia sp. XZ_19_231 TaxID=2769252 RepID=UPI00188EC831|nr:NAD(P)H nitroreductase [Nocardia sp. XZ_19_231]
MEHGPIDDRTLRAALALAGRAPSVHNTQPWRWRIGERSFHLYLDPTQALLSPDPGRRDLVVSCGAALHHLRIAFAGLGWSAVVHRLPTASDPDHLASIDLVRHRPVPLDIALSAAIPDRQTDRRPYGSSPIPPGYLGLVTERAATLGATVRHAAEGSSDLLVEAIRTVAVRYPGDSEPETRDSGMLESAETAREPDFAELLVLGTSADDRRSRLRAGEALSAVLLTATNVGLATCVLTEPFDLPDMRHRVREGVLDNNACPQAIIRIGWAPVCAPPLPVTPRVAIEDLMDLCGIAEVDSK